MLHHNQNGQLNEDIKLTNKTRRSPKGTSWRNELVYIQQWLLTVASLVHFEFHSDHNKCPYTMYLFHSNSLASPTLTVKLLCAAFKSVIIEMPLVCSNNNTNNSNDDDAIFPFFPHYIQHRDLNG